MTRAHISPDGSVIRYAPDGAPPPPGWTDLPCVDTGADLEPGPRETLYGPEVMIGADAVTRIWTVEALPLGEARVSRKAAVEKLRKAARDKGVLVSGNRWHSDEKSVGNVDNAINTGRLYEAGNGSGTYRVKWKTMEGFVSATLSDLQAAQLAIGLFVQGCFAREDTLFADITAAETVEDIFSISLDGWPADDAVQDTSFVQALHQANARLERQAKELEQQGDVTGAQLLRLQIKEI